MKKLVAVFLTLVLALSLTTTVMAEEETAAPGHGSHDGWTALTAGGTLAAGSYYLTGNVTLTQNLTIQATGPVTICLNGYALQGNGRGSVITHTKSNVLLTVCDCSDHTLEHHFTVGEDGLWTLADAPAEGTETVTGGVITGGSAQDGGGICARNPLTLSNIAVVGNRSTGTNGNGTQGGGGIFMHGNNSLFQMRNCKVYGNTAVYGGGVSTRCHKDTIFENVEIRHNTASESKSGIYSYLGCTMINCTITDNRKCDGTIDDMELFLREGPYTVNGVFGNIYVEGFSYEGTTSITINGTVNDTVTVCLSPYARSGAVNEVTIRAAVGKNIIAQELGTVTNTSSTKVFVEGNVGGNINVGGTEKIVVCVASTATVSGHVTNNGGTTTVHGTVGGSVTADAGTVVLESTAWVAGKNIAGHGTTAVNGGQIIDKRPSPSRPPSAPPEDTAVSSAETFDPGVALYAGLALTSALGAAYVTGKRR